MAASTLPDKALPCEALLACEAPGRARKPMIFRVHRVLPAALKDHIVSRGLQFSNKESPALPCLVARMMVKEIQSHAARAATGALAASALWGSLSAAFAQPPPPPPTFATTRANASMSPAQSGAARYMDMGSDRNTGFVLEQRGSVVLLQVDGSDEIFSLMPMPGPRGDTFFIDFRGRTLIKVTQGGSVVSYLHNTSGAPADPAGRVPALSQPAMTASLDAMRARAASDLSKLAGHEVTIWGTQSFGSNEAWAADALSILVLGVRNANGLAGKAAARVEKVTLVRAKTPRVTFSDGELTVQVNPDDGWAGRVTPEAITAALTSARNAG